MSIGFANEAAHIKEIGNLSTADIARGTTSDESTVRAWLKDTRSPTGLRAERLVELSSIVERLTQVMSPPYVPVWLRKPNRLLADEKPLDLIGAGEYRRVSRVVSALEDSAIS